MAFDGTRRRAVELVLLFLVLNSAISLGFTLIPLLLATFCWLNKDGTRLVGAHSDRSFVTY
jgi:hypothetical protein